jgi:sulfate permease, SulP family
MPHRYRPAGSIAAAAGTSFHAVRKLVWRRLELDGIGGWPGIGRELSAGFVAALSALTNCFAYGALIFSGPLRPFLAEGIAASLMTCFATALIYALLSRFRTAISAPIANISALLAVLTASLGPAMVGLPLDQGLALAYAALFASTAASAAALLLLGLIRAGKFVRFIPYPVIAGFMGATGWLMVVGALKMATDVPLELRSLVNFMHPREGLLLALLLAWTVALWVGTAKIKHPLILPAALVAASIVTDLVLKAVGMFGEPGRALGILFSVSGAGWPGIPFLHGQYWQADWHLLLPVSGAISAVVLISVLQNLFLTTGLELAHRQEVDLDQEMRSMGWANLASALLGGFAGQVALSATTVNRAAGGTSRLTGIVVALVALVSLLGASSVLDFIPRFVLGGVLLLQGLRLLQEWAVVTYRTLPRMEWLLVLGIILMTAWFGFVPAELGGLLAACVLFALSVSRTEVVRTISGLDARASLLVRPEPEMRILAAHGAQVQVLELRGYVFFGSAYGVREKVKALVGERRLMMLIFDFSRVMGIDSSAAATMVGIVRWLRDKGVQQRMVALSPAALQALGGTGLNKDVVVLSDLNEALEQAENAVLAAHASEASAKPAFSDWLVDMLGNADFAATLQQHLTKKNYRPGSYLCRQGDPTNDLYFIEQGRLSAIVERHVSAPTPVRVFGPRTLIGEIAFVLGVPRTASLRVEEEAIVWSLDRQGFDRLKQHDGGLTLALLQHALRLQAERLSFATRQITALQRS